jgi:hypothetical protein
MSIKEKIDTFQKFSLFCLTFNFLCNCLKNCQPISGEDLLCPTMDITINGTYNFILTVTANSPMSGQKKG